MDSVKTLNVPSVGDHPGVPLTDDHLGPLQRALSASILGDRNPMWNDAVELNNMRDLSFLTPINPVAGQINDRIAKRYSVAELNQPRDTMAVLETAIRYVYDNPFVAKATRIKADFICQDYTHKTHNGKVKDFFDAQRAKLGLDMVLRKIVWTMCGIGIVPIWWGGEDGGPVRNIEILDPRMCHIEYNFGKPTLYLKVDQKMKAAIQDPEGRVDPLNKARFNAIPKYWVDQILLQARNKSYTSNMLIELQEGSYAVVENRYNPITRTLSYMDGLPLQPAFGALQQYRLLSAGDFAVAWQLKNMITMISEGDPKTEGKEWTPASTERLTNLQSQFQRPDSAFTVYVDPTTKVEFIFPPVEIFDNKKYMQPEKEIKEILNLPSFMWISESGGNYANAVNELKLLRMEVNAIRSILQEQFFRPFYSRLRAGSGRPGFAEKDIVYPTFNRTSLQDDSVWLDAVTSLYGRGGCSIQTLIETFGLDFDYEAAQKQIEDDKYGPTDKEDIVNDTIFRPLYEPSQGNMNPARDTGGNPGTPGQAPTNPTRNPRTKGK